MFCGFRKIAGGRVGDHVSNQLADTFKNKLKLKCGRLRTGTPPRLNGSTINYSKFEKLFPDNEPIPFSFLTDKIRLDPKNQVIFLNNKKMIFIKNQVLTYIGYSNEKVSKLVLASIDENYSLKENVVGPRTCPSLEVKVLRFPHLPHRV